MAHPIYDDEGDEHYADYTVVGYVAGTSVYPEGATQTNIFWRNYMEVQFLERGIIITETTRNPHWNHWSFELWGPARRLKAIVQGREDQIEDGLDHLAARIGTDDPRLLAEVKRIAQGHKGAN